jgi:hypothetical protein
MTDRTLLEAKLRQALDMPKTGLIWYYRVGCCVAKLTEMSEYGGRCVDHLAGKPGESRATLYGTMRLAQKYPGKEFDAVRKLPWTVVRALLTVKVDEMRMELQQQASENGWSARRVKREINARQGKLEPRGGCKRQRKGVGEDLVRLAAAAREWQGLVTDVWPGYRLRKLRPDGEEIARLVDRASRPMRSLIAALKKRRLPD